MSEKTKKVISPFVAYWPHAVTVAVVIAGYATLISDVGRQSETSSRIIVAQRDHESEAAASSRRKWDDINSNRNQLSELKTQTSILRTRQETQTSDIGEMKEDIKSILRAVKR